MKLTTLIKKLFGTDSLVDYMDVKDSECEALEYWGIETDGNSEPSYFVRVFFDYVELTTINGKVLVKGTEVEVKKAIKKLI